jgi:hypothetical protein
VKQITDDKIWYQAYLETPFAPNPTRIARAHQRRDPDDLLDCPGVSLKVRLPDRGYLKTGKLVSYTDDKVVVRSKPAGFNGELKCVWIGTSAQYVSMWTVD